MVVIIINQKIKTSKSQGGSSYESLYEDQEFKYFK